MRVLSCIAKLKVNSSSFALFLFIAVYMSMIFIYFNLGLHTKASFRYNHFHFPAALCASLSNGSLDYTIPWNMFIAAINSPKLSSQQFLKKHQELAAKGYCQEKKVKNIHDDVGASLITYVAFRLFGVKVSSISILYIIILTLSVIAFAVQFRKDYQSLMLGSSLLLGLMIVLPAISQTSQQVGSLIGIRIFDILSLLATLHLLLLAMYKFTISRLTLFLSFLQGSIIALAIFTRVSTVWQLIAVVIVCSFFSIMNFKTRKLIDEDRSVRPVLIKNLKDVAKKLILIFCIVAPLFLLRTSFEIMKHPIYDKSIAYHHIWHNQIMGLLLNRNLQKIIYGDRPGPNFDATISIAVRRFMKEQGKLEELNKMYYGEMQTLSWASPMYQKYARKYFFYLIKKYPYDVVVCYLINKHEVLVRWFSQQINDSLIGMALAALIMFGIGFVKQFASFPKKNDMHLSSMLPIVVLLLFSHLPLMATIVYYYSMTFLISVFGCILFFFFYVGNRTGFAISSRYKQ